MIVQLFRSAIPPLAALVAMGPVAAAFMGLLSAGAAAASPRAVPLGGVLLANGLVYDTTYAGGTVGRGTSYTDGRMTLEEEVARGIVSAGCRRNNRGPCPPFYQLNDLSFAPKSRCDKNIPNGYAPCDLYDAYNLSNYVNNPGGTVAIVLPYRQPYIVSDAAAYRKAARLPKCSPSTGNGCVSELNEYGQPSPLPIIDPYGGWAEEWSMDVDMVSATCPNCKIVLFEANSLAVVDFATAENSAADLAGVVAINNSYNLGQDEITIRSVVKSYFHPGIAITVAAGDGGYHVDSPADYRTVTAVGGTTLTRGASGNGRKWTETVWNTGIRGVTGGGCSAVVDAQPWQTAIEKAEDLKGCSKRVVSDVAFDGDPTTGVAIYCSFMIQGSKKYCQGPAHPWLVDGGTSASAPAIAGIYGLSGPSVLEIPAELAYMSPWPSNFYDITSGSNGSCDVFWLCNAQTYYDAPSGVGSPNGIGGF
jgi:subtilase family serine protease